MNQARASVRSKFLLLAAMAPRIPMAILVLTLFVITTTAQTIPVQYWCSASAACSGTNMTSYPELDVCQRFTDPCQAEVSANIELTRCSEGLVVSFNGNPAATGCTGAGTYQILLACDACNMVSVGVIFKYYMRPLCSGIASSGPCPPAVPAPTAVLPTSRPPLSPTSSAPSTIAPTLSPTQSSPTSPPSTYTTGPSAVGPATYVTKTGQLVHAQVGLVEYFVQFDQVHCQFAKLISSTV